MLCQLVSTFIDAQGLYRFVPQGCSMLACVMQVGAFFTSIPQCVLGGMTTFLFAGVCVSGIKVSSASLAFVDAQKYL